MRMAVCVYCGRNRANEQTACEGCGNTETVPQADQVPLDSALYREIHHIVRTVSAMGEHGTISGDQADTYIASFFQDGWRLLNDRVIDLGLSDSGLTLMWVMVR